MKKFNHFHRLILAIFLGLGFFLIVAILVVLLSSCQTVNTYVCKDIKTGVVYTTKSIVYYSKGDTVVILPEKKTIVIQKVN